MGSLSAHLFVLDQGVERSEVRQTCSGPAGGGSLTGQSNECGHEYDASSFYLRPLHTTHKTSKIFPKKSVRKSLLI